MRLERVISKTISEYGLNESIAPLCYEFFSEEDAVQPESRETRALLAHKLQVALYMAGKIPVTLKEGKKWISNIPDLSLFSYNMFDFHSRKNAPVRDEKFYHLMMRIARKHSRRTGPRLDELINSLGYHPAIVKHFKKRPVTYDDVLTTSYVLLEYMTGQREITVQKNSHLTQIRINSPEDLWVLKFSIVKQGVDESLYRLWRRVHVEHVYHGKPTWSELIIKVGKQRKVVDHLRRPVTYGDIGKPTQDSDRRLLSRYLMGKIPVLTDSGKVIPRTIEDLHVFRIYQNRKVSHPDGNWVNLIVRLMDRKKHGRGKGFKRLFDEVGTDPCVEERYGRSITYRDAVLQSLLHTYALELEAFMLGEREIKVGDISVKITSISDMPFLRPHWRLHDPKVELLYIRLQRHESETGVGFYDLVDKVGTMPRVVKHYERPVTRFDINSRIGTYEERQAYAVQQQLIK